MGLNSLSRALRLPEVPCLAITGSGGKTTALFQLARELPPPVLLTTTTHLAAEQVQAADQHFTIADPKDLRKIETRLRDGVSLLTGPPVADKRIGGLSGPVLDRLYTFAVEKRIPLLVEADGSRQKPLKAEAGHEPAVPDWAKQVLVVVGLSGLGKPLTGEYVHRPEIFSAISGIDIGEMVTLEGLERVIMSPRSGLKGIPAGAEVALLLNQADSEAAIEAGEMLAGRVLKSIPRVVIGSLARQSIHAVIELTAGVILAAGASRRMGRTKQLLDWQGKPFVRQVAQTAIDAGLDPVIAVTGFDGEDIAAALRGLPVKIVKNPDWASGQSTSLAVGVGSLPEAAGSGVFLLADQPQINEKVIRKLVEAHAKSLDPIIAPAVGGRRANPVIFDRAVFSELKKVSGDVGGRGIFSKYPVTLLDWADEKLLMDVDTPEDYDRLLRAA